MNTETKLNKS